MKGGNLHVCASSDETGAVPLCFYKITRLYFPWLKYYLSSPLKEASRISQHSLLVQVKKALPAIPSLDFGLGLEAPNFTFLLLFWGTFFVLHMIMINTWQKYLLNVSTHSGDYMVSSPFPNLNSSHLVFIFFLPLKLVLFFFSKACFRHSSF